MASCKYGGLGNTTNWESALADFRRADPWNKGLVVFVTDGDPNTVGGLDGKPNRRPWNRRLCRTPPRSVREPAQDRGKPHAGGGDRHHGRRAEGPSEADLRAETCDQHPATATINDFDDVVTNNFDNLTAAMKRVAASLCGGSVTVRKYADADDPGDFQPASGWQFDATVRRHGTPTTSPGCSRQARPAHGQPDDQSTPGVPATDGVAQFQYAPKNTTTRSGSAFREKLQPGYIRELDYSCSFKGLNPPGTEFGRDDHGRGHGVLRGDV